MKGGKYDSNVLEPTELDNRNSFQTPGMKDEYIEMCYNVSQNQ